MKKIIFMWSLVILLSSCSSNQTYQHKKINNKVSSSQTYPNIHQNNDKFNFDQQPPEKMQENACVLLKNYPHWRKVLFEAKRQWKMEPSYILAFLHQESRFNPKALSKSMAYGFAQVKDDSWDWYVLKTGNKIGSRERFDDAVDFISFYAHANVKRNGVALNDVKKQYLAYHEGMGGYEQGSYLEKPWLIEVSDKVVRWANMYREQLKRCPI